MCLTLTYPTVAVFVVADRPSQPIKLFTLASLDLNLKKRALSSLTPVSHHAYLTPTYIFPWVLNITISPLTARLDAAIAVLAIKVRIRLCEAM